MANDSALVSENIAEMSRALAGADPSLVEAFLYSLLTPSEADEVAKRWALVKRIAEGIPQRDIAKELGLSLCKITRGSRELKKQDSPFRRMLERTGFPVPEGGVPRRKAARLPAQGAKASPRAAAPLPEVSLPPRRQDLH